MAQQLEGNPQLQALLALMQQSPEPEEHTDDPLPRYQQQLERAGRQIQKLKATIRRLEEELNAVRQTEEDLAHAVGACVFCWGDDPSCRACRGRGKPGAFEVDPGLFEQLILPAVRRRQAGANAAH